MKLSVEWILAIVLAIGLTGCLLQPKEIPSQVTESGMALGTPPDDIGSSVRVRKAIQDLQRGKQETARQQLGWVLMKNPKHRIANDLLDQLDVDPIKRLGKERFSYTVQPSESLSQIAGMYLADPLKFVILARYNNLQDPSRLSVGQTIQIPGKRHTAEGVSRPGDQTGKRIKQKAQPAVKQSEDTQAIGYKRAKELIDAGNFQDVIPLLETAIDANPESMGLKKLLIDSYSTRADQLTAEKQRSSAKILLEKAVNLGPSNDLIARLTTIEDEIEADRLFILASNKADEGHLEEAYKTYSQVLVYSPDHVSAQKEKNEVRIKLSEQYHRQGMQLFRRHKLDEAIAYWDKVIQIDPDHNLAAGYRTRALKLKWQLERLQN